MIGASSLLELGRVPIAVAKSGIWRPAHPAHVLGIERALRHWGQSMAALGAVAAVRYPERAAVIDENGTTTYGELDRRVERIAAGLHADHKIVAGSKVAVLCRNHRGFLEATLAASRLGADVLFVNTEFAPPQMAAVLERHAPDLLVHDAEFAAPAGIPVVLSDLSALVASEADAAPQPENPGHITILTSGTTGTPKGAPRMPTAMGLAGLMVSALGRCGLRSGEPVVIGPPLFHGLGLLTSMMALFLGSPLVLARKFDAAEVLRQVEAHRVGVIVAVPVMLRRLLDVGSGAHELGSLRVVLSGASTLGAPLASEFIGQFGPVLCDAYGSSEVGIATIANSADLIAAPGTVGRPCLGSSVRILDADGRSLPVGETGRIFVSSGLVFGGYTDGSSKTVIGRRMSTGDMGHLDGAGRLFIDGREDDMIVSGGENVHPVEVEDCLARHPAVAEAAVVGVPDDDFGQRLVGYVVLRGTATPDELIEHVRENLARYKTPREIIIIDELPRNATGKVLRNKLL
ncbi:AMP-dependent synthetase [Kribbella antibiotica]|uniref:AMP-dependent synthetase n=1 Tax=Kribbella antibiotica TaxID=190195 RepID=A0A4V2YLK1_9ACTN|nr:AMP-binding protein [Kribbella antibiotica]TDD47077.1 AMP-dependent synthetase [Kribbella antibiotica]